MKRLMADKQHLVRMAMLFALGVGGFLVARGILVPRDFGVYGHYRAGALADNMARTPAFAGQKACADCHADVLDTRAGSKHAAIACEACHGALGRHAADPENVKPDKPDRDGVCLVCHRENVAKPSGFPQVDPAGHAKGQPCSACHPHHHPDSVAKAPAATASTGEVKP